MPTRKTIPDWEYTDDSAIEGLLDSLPSSGSVYRYDYENVLNQGLWKNDIQEKYIRIRAWWSFNDAYRRRAAEDFRVPPDQETNLRRLLQLLDTNHPDESIMKAEILRELGEFDPCLQVLDRNFDEEYIKTSDIIKTFAKSGRRQVERIE